MKTDCVECGTFLIEGVNWRKTAITKKCTDCLSANRRAWYAKNKERIQAKTKEFRDSNPAAIMYQRVKTRAKREGIPFNLDPEDIQIQDACPVFGVTYVIGEKSKWNPSLDRIKPELGYVKGNVEVMSVRANSIKNDATPDELRSVAEYVDQLLVSRYD